MTQKTVPLALEAGILAAINPAQAGAGTVTTPWISAAHFQDFLAIVAAGTLGAAATLDAKIEQATDDAGTGTKDVVGAAITQLTKAGADDNKQALISLSSDSLDIEGGYTHFRLSLAVGVAASFVGAIVLGAAGRYGPAGDHDAASVDEIVTA